MGYFMVYGWIFGLDLKPIDIAVYVLLGNYGTYDAPTNSYLRCHPARSTMAQLLGVSVETVKRSLATLVKAKVLVGHTRHAPDGSQLPTEYEIVLGRVVSPVDTRGGVTSDPGGRVTGDPGGRVTGDPGGGSPVTHNPDSFDQETPPLPPADARDDGRTEPQIQKDHQEEYWTRDQARRLLAAVTTGLRTKISPKDADRLLALIVSALSRLSPLEVKSHLLSAGDLNVAHSPVGLLVYRLTNLPTPFHTGGMSGVPRASQLGSQPELDFRTEEEIKEATERAAAARVEAREAIRAARANAGSMRHSAWTGPRL